MNTELDPSTVEANPQTESQPVEEVPSQSQSEAPTSNEADGAEQTEPEV